MTTDPLNEPVAAYVRRGYSVTSRTATQVVLSRPRRLGFWWWVVNLLLVLITGGLWLIYVIYRIVNLKVKQVVFTVDNAGNVRRS